MAEQTNEDYVVYLSNGSKDFNFSIRTTSYEQAIKLGQVAFPDAQVKYVTKITKPQEP